VLVSFVHTQNQTYHNGQLDPQTNTPHFGSDRPNLRHLVEILENGVLSCSVQVHFAKPPQKGKKLLRFFCIKKNNYGVTIDLK
jgi:hypothetical protein